jgi:gamma-glutamylcyclotransferase
MSEWYFAYGSNLWIDQMTERTGPIRKGADAPRVARLANHRVVFNMHGGDGHVFANIMSPGEGVLGVVYRCSPESLRQLDTYEQGYERGHVQVVLENGERLDAVTYFAKPAHVGNCSQPSAAYLQRILDGARQHGLPSAYIQGLEAMAITQSRLPGSNASGY